jgi:hypothetical protein
MHTNLNNYIVLAIVHHKQTFGHVTLVNNYLHMVFLSWFGVMVLNATFNNTSIISWRSALLVEEKTTDLSMLV